MNLLVFVFYKEFLYFNQHSWRYLLIGFKTQKEAIKEHLQAEKNNNHIKLQHHAILLELLQKSRIITSFLTTREDMILSTTAASSSLGFS